MSLRSTPTLQRSESSYSTFEGLGTRRCAALELAPPARAALLHSSLVGSDADLSAHLFASPFMFRWIGLDKATVVTQTIHTSPQPPNTPADGRFCSQPRSPLLWNGSCSRVQSPRPRVVSRFTGKGLSFCFLFLTLKRKLCAVTRHRCCKTKQTIASEHTKQNPAFLGCGVS